MNNVKTPEEVKNIKTALACCSSGQCNGNDGKCPYRKECGRITIMAKNALAYIDDLEERIDLMMIQMRGDCGVCKHRNESAFQPPCSECTETKDNDLWEYEGLPEINSHTED